MESLGSLVYTLYSASCTNTFHIPKKFGTLCEMGYTHWNIRRTAFLNLREQPCHRVKKLVQLTIWKCQRNVLWIPFILSDREFIKTIRSETYSQSPKILRKPESLVYHTNWLPETFEIYTHFLYLMFNYNTYGFYFRANL